MPSANRSHFKFSFRFCEWFKWRHMTSSLVFVSNFLPAPSQFVDPTILSEACGTRMMFNYSQLRNRMNSCITDDVTHENVCWGISQKGNELRPEGVSNFTSLLRSLLALIKKGLSKRWKAKKNILENGEGLKNKKGKKWNGTKLQNLEAMSLSGITIA